MYFALDENGDKIKPREGKVGRCIYCGNELIPKCGLINTHHWAHRTKSSSTCISTNYESETEWHYTFKGLFKKEYVEVLVQKGGKKMRADVKLENGLVLEIQHSSINAKTIQSRNNFHKKIVWLFDASGPFAEGRLHFFGMDGLNKIVHREAKYEWLQPQKSIRFAGGPTGNPVFLDLGFGKIIEVSDIWSSLAQRDTKDEEKYGEFTVKYILMGRARAYKNYDEFVERILEIDGYYAPRENSQLDNIDDSDKSQLSLF